MVRGRISVIDSARGAAILLVCISHFALAYLARLGGGAAAAWWIFAGHIASPMFIIINGAMIGYLHGGNPQRFAVTRRRLAVRALLLVTVAHALIVIAHVPRVGGWREALRWLFVTDTIAVALLIAPLFVRMRPMKRTAACLAAYAGACMLVYGWHPAALPLRYIKDTLFGSDGVSVWAYNVPLVPGLALDVASLTVGEWLLAGPSASPTLVLEGLLGKSGAFFVGSAVAVKITYWTIHAAGLIPLGRPLIIASALASPWTRIPPSPEYMLLFGGMAMLAIVGVLAGGRMNVCAPVWRWLASLGRASAMAYVLQYYILYLVVERFAPISWVLAPFIFAGVMVAMTAGVHLWTHAGSKRRRLATPARPAVLLQPVGAHGRGLRASPPGSGDL
jgi:surface polysaccharide O-acyltransferase-like enzyme